MTTETKLDYQAIADSFENKYRQIKERKIKRSPVKSNRASQLGHECDQFLKLSRSHWQQAKLHDVDLQMRFEVGNDFEKTVLVDMLDVCAEIGASLINTQVAYHEERGNVSGHVDGIIEMEESNKLNIPARTRMVLEIKSVSPFYFDKIQTLEGFKEHPFTHKWYVQTQIYMYQSSIEGAIVFLKALGGRPRLLGFPMDYDCVDYYLKRAERIDEAVKNNRNLKTVDNPRICRRCPFFEVVCTPGLEYGSGADYANSKEVEDALNRREELEPGAKEFKELDTMVKNTMKSIKSEHLIIGAWVMTKKLIQTTQYNIPPEVKKQYAEKKESVKIQFEKVE